MILSAIPYNFGYKYDISPPPPMDIGYQKFNADAYTFNKHNTIK